MSRQDLKDFKKVWLNKYIKQYKQGNREERRAIKRNIYNNINLTEDEKDNLWELIVMIVLNEENDQKGNNEYGNIY